MNIGKVRRYQENASYGFIQPNDNHNESIYFRTSSIISTTSSSSIEIKVGSTVVFDWIYGSQGKRQAVNIKFVHNNGITIKDNMSQQSMIKRSTNKSDTVSSSDSWPRGRKFVATKKDMMSSLCFYMVNNILSYLDNLKNFHQVSKMTFNYKHLTYLYRFNRSYSLKYYNNSAFRNAILSKISNPNTQISLVLDSSNISNCSLISNIHSLHAPRCVVTDITMLGSLQHLNLSFSCVIELPKNVYWQSAHLSDCVQLQDISSLSTLHTVDLSNCISIVDICALSTVKHLNLRSCSGITDFSCLGYQYFLDLQGTQIVDVSRLGNVHTLNLSLTNVSDTRVLGNVHTLNLSLTNVTDVSSLGNVHTLNLSSTSVTDVRALSNVVDLDLSQCVFLQDVSALTNVEKLNLFYNLGITNVSKLGNNKLLNLSYCWNIEDVSSLGKVDRLILRGCSKLENVSALAEVPYLNLRECRAVKDISMISKNCKMLDIHGVIKELDELQMLKNDDKISEIRRNGGKVFT
jgi:cold shock CspA family protein